MNNNEIVQGYIEELIMIIIIWFPIFCIENSFYCINKAIGQEKKVMIFAVINGTLINYSVIWILINWLECDFKSPW